MGVGDEELGRRIERAFSARGRAEVGWPVCKRVVACARREVGEGVGCGFERFLEREVWAELCFFDGRDLAIINGKVCDYLISSGFKILQDEV